jgi:hypothetical protein
MSKKILIFIIIIILIAGISFFIFKEKRIETEIELTNEMALSLLEMECNPEGVPYHYDSCVLDVLKEEGRWIVTVTYDGLYDDSIRAIRFQTIVRRENRQWIKDEIIQTQKCWPNRGHQEFSTELCI